LRLLEPDDFLPARWPAAPAAGAIQLWYVTGAPQRQALPLLLGAALGREARALALRRGEFGKPFLAEPGAVEFNLSHSGEAHVLALGGRQALGVDIETLRRRRPVLELARRFFSAVEADALAALDPDRRQRAFLRLWSCKEAVVKAIGRGIGFGLAQLAFDLDAHGDPTRLNVIDASAGAVAEWQIVRLRPAPDYEGALAWRGPPRTVQAFRARL
jgi:4'-phosphopantetheinyl transferase